MDDLNFLFVNIISVVYKEVPTVIYYLKTQLVRYLHESLCVLLEI